MPKINYPLIVSDFDGTLLNSSREISQKTKATIKRYINAGGRFAVSTGRMPAAILPHVKALGLSGVVCCAEGGVIVDIESEEILLESRISNEIAVKICEKMEALGLHIHVFDLWEYYSNMDDEYLTYYENVVKTKAVIIKNKPISKFVKESRINPVKIFAMLDPKDNERVRLELERENFEGCNVTSGSTSLVEVGNIHYSKGTSVEFLAKRYGVDISKTIAVGDQLNDLSMIKRAGLGFAVKNADAELKKHAICLDLSNDEDAVAYIIDKYGYTEE